MEVTMLIIAILSFIVSFLSFVYTIKVKKDTTEMLRKNNTIKNVHNNKGFVTNENNAEVTFKNGK